MRGCAAVFHSFGRMATLASGALCACLTAGRFAGSFARSGGRAGPAQERDRPRRLAGRRASPQARHSSLDQLRFVTDSDYPPFHYFDEEGVLTGFNVDLARAICEALDVECEIRPVDWEDLFTNLDNGDADAAIASIRIDAESLTKADFTLRAITRRRRASSRAKQATSKTSAPRRSRARRSASPRARAMRPICKKFFPQAAVATFDTRRRCAEGAQGWSDRPRVRRRHRTHLLDKRRNQRRLLRVPRRALSSTPNISARASASP